uniref:Uncharacterized protein n=1 Tax=Sander lucioperca TaxID=283035 RepID=A0A8C9X547_SANLU
DALYLVNVRAAEISRCSFQTVKARRSANIECTLKSDLYKRVWYKVNTEKGLQLIFLRSHRHYQSNVDISNSHLSISEHGKLNEIHSGSLKTVQPGRLGALSGSVHTGRCAGEHICVTVAEKNLHHSAPQLIYTWNLRAARGLRGRRIAWYELILRNISSDELKPFYCSEKIQGYFQTVLISCISAEISLKHIWLHSAVTGIDFFVSSEAKDGSSEGNQTTDTVTYAAVCSAPRRLPTRQARGKYCGDSVVYSNISYCQQNRQVERQTNQGE